MGNYRLGLAGKGMESHRRDHGRPATESSASRQLTSAPGCSAERSPLVGSAPPLTGPRRRGSPVRPAEVGLDLTDRRGGAAMASDGRAAAIEGDEWIREGMWRRRRLRERRKGRCVRERNRREGGGSGGGGVGIGTRHSREEEDGSLCCVCCWSGEIMGLVPFHCAQPKSVNASCIWVKTVGDSHACTLLLQVLTKKSMDSSANTCLRC